MCALLAAEVECICVDGVVWTAGEDGADVPMALPGENGASIVVVKDHMPLLGLCKLGLAGREHGVHCRLKWGSWSGLQAG